MIVVDGLPDIGDEGEPSLACVGESSAIVRSARFMARISLPEGKVEWLVERPVLRLPASYFELPRYIRLFGSRSVLYFSDRLRLVAELSPMDDGSMMVLPRNAATGETIWKSMLPLPDPAAWAETDPAWPGAQTEENDGFFVRDNSRLVVGIARRSRRSRIYSKDITVDTLPTFHAELLLTRLETSTGEPVWQNSYRDVSVEILSRGSFVGPWSTHGRVGVIELESGENRVLYNSAHHTGRPDSNGVELAIPWHSKEEVGIDWIDGDGNRVRSGAWNLKNVRETTLHATECGLALQTNDRGVWWLGNAATPAWKLDAKPYVYRVHAASDSDVFVGTDGRGGRLIACDASTGRETFQLKPTAGGVGDLVKVPSHRLLICTFRVSRSHSKSPRLLLLSMDDKKYSLEQEATEILNVWTHGAIVRTGKQGGRIGILDVRRAALVNSM